MVYKTNHKKEHRNEGLERIEHAVNIAKLFIERYERLTEDDLKYWGMGFGSSRTASFRRASMELTRALAEMRKPIVF